MHLPMVFPVVRGTASMNWIRSSAVLACVLLATSCVQKWDESQRAALSSVAVPSPVIAGDAYQPPVGKMPTGPTPIIVVPGGNAGAAAVGNGLGQLVVEGIGAAQQAMYNKAHADAISRAPGTVPGDLSERIRKSVAKELSSNSFFKGKVRDGSPNRMVVNVTSYGYVRVAKVDGNILMAPQIHGSFELMDSNGKSILKQPLVGLAALQGHTLEDFANNRKLASDAFDVAIQNMATMISAAVDQKAG